MKIIRLGACAMAMSMLCACGNIMHTAKIMEPSEVDTGKEIRSAMNVVSGHFFRHFDG